MMKKIMHFMTNSFTPAVNKITKNPWIAAVQDSFMNIVPIILVASVTTVISALRDFIPALPDLWYIYKFTFGLLGLFISFLLPYNIMEKKGYQTKKTLAGLTGISLYFMIIGPKFNTEILQQMSNGITSEVAVNYITYIEERLSAAGMFTALFVGFLVGFIMYIFSKKSFFSEDSSMPDFVKVWFDSLIPITIIMLFGWYVNYKEIDFFVIILKVFSPISKIINTYPGFVFIIFIQTFFYTFGISTWALTPLVYPIYNQGLAENQRILEAAKITGETVTPDMLNIALQETVYSVISMGGVGTTLSLAVMMLLFSKSKRLKGAGLATITPSIFNINEPLMFGTPVVFNPFLMIPMWINGIVIPSFIYFVMSAGWLKIPSKAFTLWYMPYPFTSYFSTQDIKAVFFAIIVFIISFVIYFPFFKAYDRQMLSTENNK